MRCCPKEPARKITRSIYEDARDVARALGKTVAFEQSRRDRKRVEMLFAHLKRILRLGRLRLRGPLGVRDEFTLAAIAQNLRRLAKLVARPPPTAVACVAGASRAATSLPVRQSRRSAGANGTKDLPRLTSPSVRRLLQQNRTQGGHRVCWRSPAQEPVFTTSCTIIYGCYCTTN